MRPRVKLDAETWARTAARLLKQSPEEARALLDEVGLDDDAWQACDAHYRELIAREFEDDNLHIARLYASACAAETRRRKQAARAPAVPVPVPVRDAMEETSAGAPGPPDKLPFRAHPAVPPPPIVWLEPSASLGQTAPVGVEAAAPALPFGGARSLPLTSVEVYAYLCAARQRSPEQGQRACAQYRVSAEQLVEVDRHWGERMSADPQLRAQFHEGVEQAKQRLR